MQKHSLRRITDWLLQLLSHQHHAEKTVDDLRAEAGLRAEDIVRRILDSYCADNPGFKVIHNGKFEFDVENENSTRIEIDHLLITDKTIFIIETKYKSGEIAALEYEPKWVIEHAGITEITYMPNALKQAKRYHKILLRHFDKRLPIVPLVAIVGDNKLVRHNIHHVCKPEQLVSLFEMFSLYRPKCIDVEHTLRRLKQHLYN